MGEPKSQIQNRTWHRVSPYIELACAVLAGALWYGGGWPGSWPLLLLALMWSLYWLRTGFSLRPALFDVLLALFVLSAFVGTQTAYAPGPAWAKFWLVVGAWGLYYALAHQPDLDHLYVALALWGLFGVVFTAYFFMVYDWSTHPIKVPALTALGSAISARLPTLVTLPINPNVVGGVLATVLPFYPPLTLLPGREVFGSWPSGLRRGLPFLWGGAAGGALLGLLVTTSRGAWLATLVGFLLWALWWGLSGRFAGRERLAWMGGLLLTGVVLGGVALHAVLTYELPGVGALTQRLTLLRDSLLLARDYALTGAGLGTFEMNFSIYTLLIHVGYVPNSHNLFVDLWVEQGVVGMGLYLALAGLCIGQGVGAWERTSVAERWVLGAGGSALFVVLLHGQVEDVFYGSRWLLLLFLPFAWIRAVGGRAELRPEGRLVTVAVSLLLLAGLLFWRPLLAQGYASLGAMRQARLELARYEPGRTPGFIMDSIRQEASLEEVVALFERATALHPGNATARQRLAGIQLARGAYPAAYQEIVVAWEAGHRDVVTRMLLGDAHVAQGSVEEGVAMLRGLPWARMRLEEQAWSRYWIHEDYTRAAHAWRAVATLDPEQGAEAWRRAQEAERRALQPW